MTLVTKSKKLNLADDLPRFISRHTSDGETLLRCSMLSSSVYQFCRARNNSNVASRGKIKLYAYVYRRSCYREVKSQEIATDHYV